MKETGDEGENKDGCSKVLEVESLRSLIGSWQNKLRHVHARRNYVALIATHPHVHRRLTSLPVTLILDTVFSQTSATFQRQSKNDSANRYTFGSFCPCCSLPRPMKDIRRRGTWEPCHVNHGFSRVIKDNHRCCIGISIEILCSLTACWLSSLFEFRFILPTFDDDQKTSAG